MSPTIAPFIPNPVSLFLASKRDLKKNLMRIRRSKAFLLMVIHHSIPFMSLIHCSAKTSVLALAKSPIQDGLSLLSWSSVSQSNVDLFLYVLLLSRVFRGIWMRPVHFAWDIVVWNLILSNSIVNGFEGPGGFVLGVLLVGFGRGVVGRFLNGSVVILVGLFTFWTDQKLRTDDWVLHSVLSILISPCGLNDIFASQCAIDAVIGTSYLLGWILAARTRLVGIN
ncbi:hypothetical protein BDR26DRAFT_43164 [Obelidium mucronatum]|nr:hypothetical protein BDR26DRAFT_43164 [Obelidium mucronatum]